MSKFYVQFNVLGFKNVGFSVNKYVVATKFQISPTVLLFSKGTTQKKREKHTLTHSWQHAIIISSRLYLNTKQYEHTCRVYNSLYPLLSTKNKWHIVHKKRIYELHTPTNKRFSSTPWQETRTGLYMHTLTRPHTFTHSCV